MSLPYRWHPSGTSHVRRPEPGQFLPYEHAVYRIIEVTDRTMGDETRTVVIVRPAAIVSDDPRARDHDLHLSLRGYRTWQVYTDEHYPICAKCLEPLPCRDQMAERVAAASAKRMGRYEVAGICPACEEPVSQRQKSLTWPDNIEVLGGPPVTFHMRRRCKHQAREYEKRWVAADPERRKATLSCPGHVTNHNDGTYECSEFGACPGPTAAHPSYTVCRCPDCRARGLFGCHPRPGAERRTP